ncbi:hypothetical protein HKBW3S43_01184 [Candidatus Hakubella thermalkaliphila]|uniref:Uncharacterized protein n=1 Tax=Candidatus Hakubella thermalkaliphila TaxID=2754717 RepID=A0A6V8NY90_9ACTN|nr:hypothetical protein HKBW3S25_00697 [Candidatus Hakubella thermalkaliphila]GFP35392.1 hypothetical protein HKBW3S43_01184 [Candidatus Hakubella thermalkaliphila]
MRGWLWLTSGLCFGLKLHSPTSDFAKVWFAAREMARFVSSLPNSGNSVWAEVRKMAGNLRKGKWKEH